MRRLLCNQVSIALAGTVLHIIASEYYHGVDCQEFQRPFSKLGPQVSSSYKKFSETFLKSLSEHPVDVEVFGKTSGEEDDNHFPGISVKNGLRGAVKVVDHIVDEFFTDSGNPEKEVENVGSPKRGGDNEGFGGTFAEGLRKTGKYFKGGIFANLKNSEKANEGDPVVGSAKGNVDNESFGTKFEHRLGKAGKFVDLCMDGIFGSLENSEEMQNHHSDGDPLVGSAKGGGDKKDSGGNFHQAFRHTGKFVDKFVDRLFGDFDGKTQSDSVGDPVVGSANPNSDDKPQGDQSNSETENLSKDSEYDDDSEEKSTDNATANGAQNKGSDSSSNAKPHKRHYSVLKDIKLYFTVPIKVVRSEQPPIQPKRRSLANCNEPFT